MKKLKEFASEIGGFCILVWIVFAVNDVAGHKFFNTVFITRIEIDRTNGKMECYGINIFEKFIGKITSKNPSGHYLSSSSEKPEGFIIEFAPAGEYGCFYDTDNNTLRVMNDNNVVWYNLQFINGLGEGVGLNAGCKFIIKD